MKKVLVSILLLGSILNSSGQTPISLIYQAVDSISQDPVALDSIIVFNLTQNCDTTLYDSVSILNILALWPVGISEPADGGSDPLIIEPNVPNPFHGFTSVNIFLKQEGTIHLRLIDYTGRSLAEFRNTLTKGWHAFKVSAPGPQQLLLNVSEFNWTKSIKLISTGSEVKSAGINYTGPGKGITLKSIFFPEATNFLFYLGDELLYTAYVNGYNQQIITDDPVSSETYLFRMAFYCGTTQINYGGQAYNTVKIGTQCWLRESLNIGTRINVSQSPINNGIIEKYCFMDADSNCSIYGGLYFWDEAMQYNTDEGAQGICPAGWHIPTQLEWNTMANWLGNWNTVGGMLKEEGTDHWYAPNTGATNSTGFTALGAGSKGLSGYGDLKMSNDLWSSSPYAGQPGTKIMIHLSYNTATFGNYWVSPNIGYSIRCLKD